MIDRQRHREDSEWWYQFYKDKFDVHWYRGEIRSRRSEFNLLRRYGLILSVGCGRGIVDDWLSRMGYTVVAVDMSTKLILLVKQHMRYLHHLLIARAEYLPFRDAIFDVAWTEGLMEHYTTDDQLIILREQARVATDIIISVPSEHCRYIYDEISYDRKHWEQLCAPLGDFLFLQYINTDGIRYLMVIHR